MQMSSGDYVLGSAWYGFNKIRESRESRKDFPEASLARLPWSSVTFAQSKT